MRGGLLARLAATTLVAGAALIGFAAPVAAEQINQFTVDAQVETDSSLHLVETIAYDFQGMDRHGIFRDIPVFDETLFGQRRYYQVDVESVEMDGGSVPWLAGPVDGYLRIVIGNPNRTISGEHTYVITYTVEDALRVITPSDADDPTFPANVAPGDVELFWDFVGVGWDVPIAVASAQVRGPGPVLSAKCYYGDAGSTDPCSAVADANRALLGPVSLSSQEALTGAITFPGSAFTSAPTENVRQGLPSSPAVGIGLGIILAVFIIGIPAAYAVSHRRRDKGAPVPGAPAQYGPPDDLSPAEMSAAWHGETAAGSARVLLATLLDLSGRGWISVSSPSGKQLSVTWLGTGTTPMRAWEERILALVLKGLPTATLTTYDKKLADGWKAAFAQLVREQEASGRRNKTGNEPDRRWRGLGIAAVLMVVVAFLSIFIGQQFVTATLITLAVATVISFVVARVVTPRRETEQSALFLAKVAGLRKVLDTDPAAARREFAQRSGLAPAAVFATMLPFAVVFQLERSWIGAFPDLTAEDLSRSGFQVASISMMDSFVSSSSASMSSATTAPSSSGGGSGSGGGGSSGGGGGGGGGGSW